MQSTNDLSTSAGGAASPRDADVHVPARPRRILAGLAGVCRNLCLCGALIVASSPPAVAQESRFEIDADGANVRFDVQHVPRREVLSHLYAGTKVDVIWRNAALGDEPITGSFSGSRAEVTRQVLRETDFAIGYDGGANPVRVIILGPSRKRAGSTSSAGAGAAGTAGTAQPVTTFANATPRGRAAAPGAGPVLRSAPFGQGGPSPSAAPR